jgi:hypothetical protein
LIAIGGDWGGRRQVLAVDLVQAGKNFPKALKDRGSNRPSCSAAIFTPSP